MNGAGPNWTTGGAMIDRDWLDGLIRKIFGDEPAMTGSGLQFSRDGAFRLRDAILAAQSHRHSWEGPIWCCDVCGPCESEPCGLGNCVAAPEPPSAPAPEREIDVCTRCGEECKDQDLTGCEGCRLSPSEVRREGE